MARRLPQSIAWETWFTWMTDIIWYMYVLECADGSLYCGITTDPQRRLLQHNGEKSGGAKYTRSRRPVKLLRSWPHSDRASAAHNEWRFKRLPRPMKLKYVADPNWNPSQQ